MVGLLETGTLGGFDIAVRWISGNGGKFGKNMLPHAAAFFCTVSCHALIGKNDLWQFCVIFVPQPRPLEINRD